MLALIQIFKKDVDSSGTMHAFPHCELTAMWTGQGKPSQLAHEVTLNGAKKPYNCFLIVLDVTPPGKLPLLELFCVISNTFHLICSVQIHGINHRFPSGRM